MTGDATNRLEACTLAMRRFLARTPFFLPLAAVAGAVMGNSWWLLSIAAVLVAFAFGRRRIALAALLGALCCWAYLARNQAREEEARSLWLNPPEQTVEVTGSITRAFRSTALLDDERTGRTVELGGLLLPPARPGERWKIEGCTREIEAPVFPGEFDRRQWLASLGCIAHLDVLAATREGSGSWPSRMLGWAESARDSLAQSLGRGVDRESAAYQTLVSLVLGEKNRADPETIDTFRRSGCLHAFAVSGLHIGLLALLAGGLLRLAHCPPRTRHALLLLVLGVYLFITGFPVSAVRAYAMVAVFLGARLLRRPCTLANTWCAAAFLILLINPEQLFQAGFQLSFAIYAMIAAGGAYLNRSPGWWAADALIPRRLLTRPERLRNAAGAWARGLVVISLLAWLASLPAAAYHFRAIPLYGFAANVMIAPLLPVAMGLGLFAAAVSGLPCMLPWANKAACFAAGALLQTAEIPANWPGCYLPVEKPAPADAAAIFAFRYSTACVLGNPGVLVDCGSANDARFRLAPALFASNYAPAAIVLTRTGASPSGGLQTILQTYPRMAQPPFHALPKRAWQLVTRAGRFTVYPPALPAWRATADDYAPVVLWEHEGRKLLYVGSASLDTVRRLPERCRRADCLVVGSHRYRHALDDEWIASTGAKRVYLLPDAVREHSGFADQYEYGARPIAPNSCATFRLSDL